MSYKIRAMPVKRAYPANQFVFILDDGKADGGLIRSVSGGGVRGEIVEEGLGNDFHHAKHVGVVELEAITLEMGMALSGPFLEWLRASWRKEFSRMNGEIIHADFDYRERVSQSFRDALITETKFPSLDGGSKEPAYLTVSLQPEHCKLEKGNNQVVRGVDSPKQKLWTASSFRLDIDGIDCSHVNKIDGFAVKQKVKQFHTGEDRFPQIEPTGLEFPNLTIYLALDYAADFIDWHDEYVMQGAKENVSEKNGSITFLSQDTSSDLFSIVLYRVGICNLEIEKSSAASDDIKRCKIELYVESMDLKFGSGM